MTSLIPCSSCVILSPRMIETTTERNPHSSIRPVFVCESPDHGKTASFLEFSEFFPVSLELGIWNLGFRGEAAIVVAMHGEHHSWYSHRLSRDMGVNVYGNYGMPILAFPTSMGDEHEQEGQGMVRTLGPYIEEGRIRFFSINGVQSDSYSNKDAHPFHRSWLQAQYDDYIASEVLPFIESQCQSPGIAITTYGASLGAYHAANTLFKHPDHVKRCYALSGIYDMRDSMDGMYDDNFY